MKTDKEIKEKVSQLNKVKYIITKRADGSTRIQQDYSACPSMTEQHSANLTNINFLMKKYKPDELAAYLAAKRSARQEVFGHDFSKEPDKQGAMNTVYQLRRAWEEVDPRIKAQFRSHIEFLRYIDNPANQEKLIAMGIMTKKEISEVTSEATTKTEDAKEKSKAPEKSSLMKNE